ncbi:MAG: hypothetical protein PHW96_04875, partial [Candidatus Nanoarchaeia archaeon]|nr:hypothetical protein [Candidatus Nanoarchaeia archaeon]
MNKIKLKEIFTNWKIILMLLFLLFAYSSLGFNYDRNGVYVLNSYEPATEVMQGDIIIDINGIKINNLEEYEYALSLISPGDYPIITVKRPLLFTYTQVEIYPFKAEEKRNSTYLGLAVSEIPVSNLKFGLEIDGGTRLLLKPVEHLSESDFVNVVE